MDRANETGGIVARGAAFVDLADGLARVVFTVELHGVHDSHRAVARSPVSLKFRLADKVCVAHGGSPVGERRNGDQL